MLPLTSGGGEGFPYLTNDSIHNASNKGIWLRYLEDRLLNVYTSFVSNKEQQSLQSPHVIHMERIFYVFHARCVFIGSIQLNKQL